MKKPTNKKGSRGYGKFIDSFRKTKPQMPKSALKKHKRKLKKSDMGFQVEPNTKIRSKFSEPDDTSGEQDSTRERATTLTQVSLMKAIKGTPGYDQWLEKIRALRSAHAKGATTAPKKFSTSHSSLLNSARTGDLSMMHHPEAHNIRDAQGMSMLHHLARAGKKEILGHEQVHSTRDSMGRSPLHLLAERNIPEVLGHPHVSNVHDMMGNTPIHVLAQQGNPAVLQHPDVSTVKNLKGRTPLHSAAFAKINEAQQHPDFNIAQDNFGRTPENIWSGVSGREPVKEPALAKSYFDFRHPLLKSDPIKERTSVNGIDVALEWPKGSIRTYQKNGVTKKGKKQKAGYGYIPDTYTEDSEELDVYLGPNRTSDKVYLLMQKPTPYDVKMGYTAPEEKWMLGFESIKEAEKAYKASMPSQWFECIQEVKWAEFDQRVKEARNRLYRAKKAGLITLPEDVKGTNCGNCKFFNKGFCGHQEVSQPVLKSQCCDYWYRLGTSLPPDLTLDEYNNPIEKAVGPYTPIQDTAGMFTAPETSYVGFNEFKKAQGNLKKDLESLPAVTAQQGSKEQGAVYSFADADNFNKGANKKRLKLASKLKEISKANAFVGDAGFVARPRRKVPDTSAQSKPFVSVEKNVGDSKKRTDESAKAEMHNRATNPFLANLQDNLKKFRKSTSVEGGMLKYDMVNKIHRMKYNKERLASTQSENSDVKDIKKSIDKAVVKLNKMPRFVFTI